MRSPRDTAIDSDGADGSWAGNRTFVLRTHDKHFEGYITGECLVRITKRYIFLYVHSINVTCSIARRVMYLNGRDGSLEN